MLCEMLSKKKKYTHVRHNMYRVPSKIHDHMRGPWEVGLKKAHDTFGFFMSPIRSYLSLQICTYATALITRMLTVYAVQLHALVGSTNFSLFLGKKSDISVLCFILASIPVPIYVLNFTTVL